MIPANMNPAFRTRLLEFIKGWTMLEIALKAAFCILAILLFFGYAVYIAAHNVKF